MIEDENAHVPFYHSQVETEIQFKSETGNILYYWKYKLTAPLKLQYYPWQLIQTFYFILHNNDEYICDLKFQLRVLKEYVS